MEKTEQACRDLLKVDPGNPEFVDFAAALVRQGRFLEALEVCLADCRLIRVSHRPVDACAGIISNEISPFAIRELTTLCADFHKARR